ncbi:MAG: SprT family zinc-dependent metalloprotease [Raoultibacter sp.]
MSVFSKPQGVKRQAKAPEVSPCVFMVEGIAVRLTRKQVKNVNLRVKSGGCVEVSAPEWVTTAKVEEFVKQRASWIRARQRAVETSLQTLKEQATDEQLRAWRQQVEREVPALIARWEPVIGVTSHAVVYRSMSSRWGSCNPRTGRICINIQLAAYPAQCLEYVVVHELCHLLEGGHGPRFKALMTHFLPDWKQRRALLK